jgi:hypothetical protein
MYGVLISIAVNAIILKYVLENERNNCECALTWHHNFIKLYAPVVIFLSFVRLLFEKEVKKGMNNKLFKFFFGLLGVISVVYSITLIIYFFKLKRDSNCECSKNWKRKALIYPLIIIAIVLLAFLFISLLVMPIAIGAKKR